MASRAQSTGSSRRRRHPPWPEPAQASCGHRVNDREAQALREVLVVANRTLGGEKLLEAVRARAAAGDVRFRLIVPQSKPSAGLVIYDESVRESAQARVDLALSLVASESIEASGEVGDPDPF